MRIQMKLISRSVKLAKKKFEVEMQPTLSPKINKIIMNGWIEKGGRLGEEEMTNFLIDNFSSTHTAHGKL